MLYWLALKKQLCQKLMLASTQRHIYLRLSEIKFAPLGGCVELA
ncbi:MAG: hypothetical protein QNJ60_17670 [Xenococcaceae cyanobacterium MO_188.B19]|nr:hypothetical protein [Xenococcaceae cyanobacterium MO_188.B19]